MLEKKYNSVNTVSVLLICNAAFIDFKFNSRKNDNIWISNMINQAFIVSV